MGARATRSALALPLSALWLMGLMSLPPVRKERVLLAVERGGDSLAQFSRFCQEVIKPPKNATKEGVGRILGRHSTNCCNWYSINYGLVDPPRLRSMNLGGELRRGKPPSLGGVSASSFGAASPIAR